MSVIPWVKEGLQQAGVLFEEIHHPTTYTAQRLAQEEHVSGHQVLKVVLAVTDRGPIQLVLPASRRVSFDRVTEIVGGQYARLATEEEMARTMSDCQLGAAPPMRHWDFELWMDRSVGQHEFVLFHGGTHQDAVRMHFDDWYRLAKPRVSFGVVFSLGYSSSRHFGRRSPRALEVSRRRPRGEHRG